MFSQDKNISKPLVSVVVPFLNETDCISSFCNYIDEKAKDAKFEMEIIFVDDGSKDNSIEKIRAYKFQNLKKIKLIKLSKNFGSHAAIRAGIKSSTGDYCTFIGIDMEEPENILDIMFENIIDEKDIVCIEKKTIQIGKINRLTSKIFSSLIRKYAVKEYGSGGINNIMFSKKVANFLNENIESNSSIQLQILNAGFNSITIEMDYKSRVAGQSKWTFSKKIKLFIDSFVAFSFVPIRAVSIFGFLFAIFGLIYGIVIIINYFTNSIIMPGYSTLVAIILFGFGVTNISLGIIAEYLWRTYDATRNRPVFIIDYEEDVNI